MKGKILVSTLIALLILIAITAPTFATKQSNPGINPLNTFLVEIESVQNSINSDIVFDEENNAPQDNNIVYRYITNTTASKPTLDTNVKDVFNWAEVRGIPFDVSDGDDYTNVANNGYLASESNVIAVSNVKEEIDSREFSGITASFSVRPAP